MHILTKIFIVLVALMAVMLVPLVVVYAHNEDSFKAKFQSADAQRAAAVQSAEAARASLGARTAELTNQNEQLRAQNSQIMGERDRLAAEGRRVETELAASKTLQSEMYAKLSTLSSAVDVGQQLTSTLISDLALLRQGVLKSEQKVVEMEDANRDIRAQLEVAVEARRAMQEELQRVKEEQAKAMDKISQYVAMYGALRTDIAVGAIDTIAPDRSLDATVVNVRQNDGGTLVEISAGSRDGVKTGWRMTVSRGSQFLGDIQIIEVDVNRSVGLLSLSQGVSVQPGDVARAFAGR